MKKKIVGFTIALGLVAGGTGYAAANIQQELKQQYHEEIIGFMNDFKDRYQEQKVDQNARIKQETAQYLEQKLNEFDKRKMAELNQWDKEEADRVIQELKEHIDKEIAKY
jgi:hypothetical protein